MGGEKMAKSVGNIVAAARGARRAGAATRVIVYFVDGHYRQPMAFDDDVLAQAAARVRARARGRAAGWSTGRRRRTWPRYKERFFDALRDDFNTPAALAAAFEWIREANRARSVRARRPARDARRARAREPARGRDGRGRRRGRGDARAPREEARAARDFAEADRLRDELRARGWEVRDGPAGLELVPVP